MFWLKSAPLPLLWKTKIGARRHSFAKGGLIHNLSLLRVHGLRMLEPFKRVESSTKSVSKNKDDRIACSFMSRPT